MNVPFVDFKRSEAPYVQKINKKIQSIIQKGEFILGQEVVKFEEEFAKYIGVKYCKGVGSGTDALILALKTLEIGSGDEVLVPAISFIATASSVVHIGAKPVFVDIHSDTHTIDVSHIEKAITKKTKAVIVVHLYGFPCEMDKLIKVARKYNLKIIEDAAQSHGSLYFGRKTGSFGDISVFSFYPSKNLGAYGDGGAIATSNKKIAEKISILRNHGQIKKDFPAILGYNSRLDEIQAGILRIKLAYLNSQNKKRAKAAYIYNSKLENTPVILPPEDKNILQNYHLFTIQSKRRDLLMRFLLQKNIVVRIHYPLPLPAMKPFSQDFKNEDSFPNAYTLSRSTLSLPLFPGITDKEILYVVNCIKDFYEKK